MSHWPIYTRIWSRILTVAQFYVSKPGDIATAKPLFFLCNGAGIHSPNNQAHADQFASEGFLVVMPDLFVILLFLTIPTTNIIH